MSPSSIAHISDLPEEVLGLILDKVDFGGSKQAVLAISGSCKTLQKALRRYQAVVKLQGLWQPEQIAGTSKFRSSLKASLSYGSGRATSLVRLAPKRELRGLLR